MNPKLKYLIARFEEPSTWAGAGVGAVLIHATLPGSTGDAILGIVAAFAAALAVFLPETAPNDGSGK